MDATVKPHKKHELYSSLVSILESLGFNAATPVHEGERVIEATKYIDNVRISFRLHVEEYGSHIEGEPILPRRHCLENIHLIGILNKILGQEGYSRLDLNEDGWITITSFIGKTEKENRDAVSEISSVYYKIAKKLEIIK